MFCNEIVFTILLFNTILPVPHTKASFHSNNLCSMTLLLTLASKSISAPSDVPVIYTNSSDQENEKKLSCEKCKEMSCCSCDRGNIADKLFELSSFTNEFEESSDSVAPLTGAAFIATSAEGKFDEPDTILAPIFQLSNGLLKFVFHEISGTGVRRMNAGTITAAELLKTVMKNIGPRELVDILDESAVLEVFRRYKNVYDYSD